MIRLAPLLLALLACASPAETEDYAIRAAMLDPACYTMAGTAAGGLDVTVPTGHSWHVTNAFAVYYGDPISVSQDAFPLTRRTGFLRPLDARRELTLGAGTRIRSNTGINLAYVLYCDPADLWASDSRYTTDPRGLYYERLQLLRTIPTESVALEATGGGAITDEIHAALPAVPLILTSASVYDASWVTAGCPAWVSPANVLSEINNAHAVRFAESIQQPMPACGARVTLQKGSLGDTWGPAAGPVGVFFSADPAVANPIHGSGFVTYQRLPKVW